MKLLRLYVENFGKINNLELNFEDGINAITEPNAWGKSTLAAFIKVMLFGFESKKASALPESERSFYKPWQGGTYGGELDFSVGNRSYRISRTFGASERTDVCHVYDLQTMLESVDFAGNVGEILFDLDSNSFKRSVFIAQNDCASQSSDAINAKLGNLAENTNDINNYETAQSRLKEIVNALTPNRATGRIKKRTNMITELEQELKGYDAAVKSLEEFSEKRDLAEDKKNQLIQERDELANRLRLVSEDSRRRELQRRYRDLCADVVEKLEALEAFRETFPVGVPDEALLNAQIEKARELEQKRLQMEHLRFNDAEEAQYQNLSSMFTSAIPTEIEIDQMISRYGKVTDMKEDKFKLNASLEEKEKTSMVVDPFPDKPKPVNAFTVAGAIIGNIGILTFVATLVLFLLHKYPPYFMFIGVALILAATVIFVLANLNHRRSVRLYEDEVARVMQRQQEEIDEIGRIKDLAIGKENEITDLEEEVRQFLERFSVYCPATGYSGALYELKAQVKEYLRLHDRKQEYDRTEFACRDIVNKIAEFLGDWHLQLEEPYTQGLLEFQKELVRYRGVQKASAEATEKKNLFEREQDMADVELHVDPQDLDEINEQIAEYDSHLESVRAAIDQYQRQIEQLREQLDEYDERRGELATLLAKQEEDRHRFDIVSRTQEYLATAKEQFTARYMAPISNAFRKYYNRIIETQGDDWVIDAHIALKRREMGELRELTHLSAGYQDLIGVCMRLALVDAMYQEEKPFLVFDDPFVNLDEEKTKKGMELLNFVAEEYQLIYFTCHNSRTPT
ncbi:ATP-binding protein [Agathobacter ruminis]|uniref:ATP-binding protein n=1 Tax=Agathobacter ruminis TaxID=1712665 RepID=UPI001670631A|nr:AAA family ATPase [Agathobacter ruminis]MDC7302187.1 AAA family ATPase [Agathobacter ruminis]